MFAQPHSVGGFTVNRKDKIVTSNTSERNRGCVDEGARNTAVSLLKILLRLHKQVTQTVVITTVDPGCEIRKRALNPR